MIEFFREALICAVYITGITFFAVLIWALIRAIENMRKGK